MAVNFPRFATIQHRSFRHDAEHGPQRLKPNPIQLSDRSAEALRHPKLIAVEFPQSLIKETW